MQINIYKIIFTACIIVILCLAGWSSLNIMISMVATTTMILLLHRKNGVTEIQTKYNDKLFPNGMGLCFHIPEQGKTPLQTLTYNRKFNPGTETFTCQKNSRV